MVSHLDRLAAIPDWKVCDAYRYSGKDPTVVDFIEVRDEQVTGIKVPADPTKLDLQEKLTSLLMEMKPMYSPIEREQGAYLEKIEQEFDIPIVLASAGPTAMDKREPERLAINKREFVSEQCSV